jgi:hypothetical protein
MLARGGIVYRERAKQLRDFSGLQFGKITPTDIDGFIEYKNKCYVIMEAKYVTGKHSYGQTLALERLCDDLQKTKPTLLIFARHSVEVNQDVDYSKCRVERYRYKGAWHVYKANVKELIDIFLQRIDERDDQLNRRPEIGL